MQLISRNLFKYFLLTFTFTWLLWLVPVIRNDLFKILGTFIPSIMGIILLRMENRSFKDIFKFSISFHSNLIWIFYSFLLMPCLILLAYLFSRFGFNSTYELDIINNPIIIPLVFVYIFFVGGPLGEEIGWRGYALNKLLERFNPFISSLILGLLWSLWHIPLFSYPGTPQSELNFFSYLIYTTIITLLMTVLHIKTNRNVFAAIIFHTTSNLSIGLFPIFVDLIGQISIFIVLLLALTIIILLNRTLMFNKLSTQLSTQK